MTHPCRLPAHPQVAQIKEEVEVKSISYPWYYTVPFHGYDTGNLSWQAAFEVEPATQVMALRVWKTELDLDPATAQARLRRGILDAAREFMRQHGVAAPKDMIDIGCATGERLPQPVLGYKTGVTPLFCSGGRFLGGTAAAGAGASGEERQLLTAHVERARLPAARTCPPQASAPGGWLRSSRQRR